jgi:hypothetical protein
MEPLHQSTVTTSVDHQSGQLLIQVRPSTVLAVSAPVVRQRSLDEPEGFFTDAMAACSAHVPQLAGFADEFRVELRKLQHPPSSHSPSMSEAEQMLRIFDYTASRLLYDKFDGNNPGHVLIAAQCFSGIWGGVAAQCFAAVLVRRCEVAAAAAQRQLNPLEVAIAVLSSTAKCFGCSMRIAPLIPRWPDGNGNPPDPVVLLADALVARFPTELPFAHRDDLISALRAWHVPQSVRDSLPDWKRTWIPQRQYDRARSMMQLQMNVRV